MCGLLAGLLLASAAQAEVGGAPMRAILLQAMAVLCPAALEAPEAGDVGLPDFALAGVEDRGPEGAWIARRLRFEDKRQDLALVLFAVRRGGALQRVTLELYDDAGQRPVAMALADGACAIHHGRALRYDEAGAAELVLYGPGLATEEGREPLNPPVPAGVDPGGVTVAQIDSGVNYLLPEIAARLARDDRGQALGYDYWDLDSRPFDGDTGRSPFFPIRHGTPVASLLIAEAPAVRLIPYRYPRPDMARLAEAIDDAAAAGAGIVALPMGSTRRTDWVAFEVAAVAHPEMLFIVSAGDDGRNIDETPLFPASLALDNMIVVASADAFGKLAPGANWGPESVDLMVPAERIEVTDYRGARSTASGSSFAVPRVAALAARLKAGHPEWAAAELKGAILGRAVPPLERGPPRVGAGWIPNPADDG